MKNVTQDQRFKITLANMPLKFTSHEFKLAGTTFGITQEEINNLTMNDFLKANCKRESKYTWIRKPIVQQREINYTPEQMTEQEAINFLKERGYKIIRVTEVVL